MTDTFRPITARALTSCIDVLRPLLPGSRILDLYAGQGRFILAALKEGAAFAVAVERDKKTAAALGKVLRTQKAQIVCGDTLQFLKNPHPEKFDIVFADPPFSCWNNSFQDELFQAVRTVVKDDSIFVVKHPKRVVASESVNGFCLYKTSVFGDSKLLYYRYGR